MINLLAAQKPAIGNNVTGSFYSSKIPQTSF